MITVRVARGLSAGLTCALLGIAGWEAVPRNSVMLHPLANVRTVEPPDPTISADSLANLAAEIVENDAFRSDRRPVPEQVHLARSKQAQAVSQYVLSPSIRFSGVVGGHPWRALLEGVPGQAATIVVGVGDTLGAIHVRAISPRRVVIAGNDTSWVLTLKQPWP